MKKETAKKLRAKRESVTTGKAKPGEVLRLVTEPDGKERLEPAPGQRRKKG